MKINHLEPTSGIFSFSEGEYPIYYSLWEGEPSMVSLMDDRDRYQNSSQVLAGAQAFAGKPMAKLVPQRTEEVPHLADVEGWLDDDDPFFGTIETIVEERSRHLPRVPRGEGPFDS